MLSNLFGRLMIWLKPVPIDGADVENVLPKTLRAASIFELDPNWHGDHWQNLLSSPMDARRYVIEDWSVSTTSDWTFDNSAALAQ